jgi:hypothetical protein
MVTRDEIEAGLRAGRTLIIDRKDAEELPIVMEMQNEGIVTTELVQHDEQSSSLRVKWVPV